MEQINGVMFSDKKMMTRNLVFTDEDMSNYGILRICNMQADRTLTTKEDVRLWVEGLRRSYGYKWFIYERRETGAKRLVASVVFFLDEYMLNLFMMNDIDFYYPLMKHIMN